MRTLNANEVDAVSGGDWSVGFDFGWIEGTVSGDESIQEIFTGAGAMISDAYWGARDAMADFYESVANSFAYDLGCSGGGGR